MFKYNQFTGRQVSPGASGAPGPTPGGFGGVDYFAAGGGQGATPGSTPSASAAETPGVPKMKIKLGGFK